MVIIFHPNSAMRVSNQTFFPDRCMKSTFRKRQEDSFPAVYDGYMVVTNDNSTAVLEFGSNGSHVLASYLRL